MAETFEIDIDQIVIEKVDAFNLLIDSAWLSLTEEQKRRLRFRALNSRMITFDNADRRGLATIHRDVVKPGMTTDIVVELLGDNGVTVEQRASFSVGFGLSNDTTGMGGVYPTNTVKAKAITVPTIIAKENFTVALRADGTVWTWGKNDLSDRLGSANDQYQPVVFVPTQVRDNTDPTGFLTGVTQVAAGDRFVLALKQGEVKGDDGVIIHSGLVYGWGYNENGQLARNDTTDILLGDPNQGVPMAVLQKFNFESNVPVPIGLDQKEDERLGLYVNSVAKIAAEKDHAVAVMQDGSLYAWGLTADKRLGRDKMSKGKFLSGEWIPVNLVQDVALGEKHTAIVKKDGTVWVMGDNTRGQLGNGQDAAARVNSEILRKVVVDADTLEPLGGVVTMEAGDDFTIALDADNNIWIWGGYQGNDHIVASKLVDGNTFMRPIYRMAAQDHSVALLDVAGEVKANENMDLAQTLDWVSVSMGEAALLEQGANATDVLTGAIAASASDEHVLSLIHI